MRLRLSSLPLALAALLLVLTACGGAPKKCAQVCDLWTEANELQRQCVGFVLNQRGYEVYGNATCEEVRNEGQCLSCWSDLGVDAEDCAAVYDACLSGDGIKVDLGGLRIGADGGGANLESGNNEVSVDEGGLTFQSGDKKVSIGLGGIQVDSGDDKVDVSVGGVTVRSGREVSCKPGEPCICETGENCNFRCPSGDCEITCGSGSECEVGCSGGDCKILCGTGATCDTSCSGGDCNLTCGTASDCSLDCSGGGCSCRGASCP